MAGQQDLINAEAGSPKVKKAETPTSKAEQLQKTKAKLEAQLRELERKEKRINWGKDEKRAHQAHLKILLAAVIMKAAKNDEALKKKLLALVATEKDLYTNDEQRFEFDEIAAFL